MVTLIALIVLTATFVLIEGDRLEDATALIQKQLDFFVNTIVLVGSCKLDVTSFLDKNGVNNIQEIQVKNLILQNLEVMKNHLNNLMRKKNLVVKNLLNVMYSNERGIHSDRLQNLKQELVEQMMEVKQLAFQHTFKDGMKLYTAIDSNLTQQHQAAGSKMLDPAKENYDQSLAKLSEDLGLPTII